MVFGVAAGAMAMVEPAKAEPPLVSAAAVAVAENNDGRMEVFAVRADGQLVHTYNVGGQQYEWMPWWALNRPPGDRSFTGTPAVMRQADRKLIVVARDTTGSFWFARQYEGPAESWGGWQPLDGWGSDSPTLVRNGAGLLEVFVKGGSGELYMKRQTALNAPTWTGWTRLPGRFLDSPSAVARPDGTVSVFVKGEDHTLYHTVSGPGGMTPWAGVTGSPTFQGHPVAVPGQGRQPMAVVNAGSVQLAQLGFGAPRWRTVDLGPSNGSPGAAADRFVDDTTVFLRNDRDNVRGRLLVGGIPTGITDDLGGVVSSDVTAFSSRLNFRHVFAVGRDGRVYRNQECLIGGLPQFSGWRWLEGGRPSVCENV
jgi:hypothetical protein